MGGKILLQEITQDYANYFPKKLIYVMRICYEILAILLICLGFSNHFELERISIFSLFFMLCM